MSESDLLRKSRRIPRDAQPIVLIYISHLFQRIWLDLEGFKLFGF